MCLRLKKCPCSVFCLLAGSSDLKEKAIVSASNLWFIETNRVSMNTVKRHWNWNSEHKVVANTDPEQKVIFQWGATLEQAEDLFADQEWASWTCAEFGYLSDFTQIPSPDPFSCKWSPVPFISANKRTRKLNICNLQHRISCKWQDYFVQYHVLCDLRCLAVITVDTDEKRTGLCNIIARPPPPRHTVWPGLDSDHEIELTRSNCPAVLCRRRFTEHNCNWGAKHPTDMKQLMVYFTWSVTICGSFRTRTLSAWVHCFRCPQFANFNLFPVLHVVYDASYNLLDVFVHLFDRFAGINRLAKRWLQERFVERTLCTLWCDGLQKYDMFELVTQLTFQSCSSNSL